MARHRRYDLIAFDVDGTLVDDAVFVWHTLHNYFDTDPEAREMAFQSYMSGEWKYHEWFEHDIKLLTEAGADQSSMMEAIRDMRLVTGATETLTRLRKTGARLVIISGSLNLVVDKFRLDRFFDEVHVNHIWFDEVGRLADWKATPYDVWDKATGLRQIAARFHIPMTRTAFVGDNFNDVAIAKAAAFSLAINCKSEELAGVVDAIIPDGDLRGVLPYLL